MKTLGKLVICLAIAVGAWLPSAVAIDMVWDDERDGFWDEPLWNGGMTAEEVVGVNDGADGFRGDNAEVQNIIIGGGWSVEYDADFLGTDFEMRQGSTLTIHEGATWLQNTLDSWAENRWTEMDLTSLTIDGGTFSRVGNKPGEGGGALIFGSWQGDDTFDEPESLDYMDTSILITNGGLLENEGQLWFGGWGDTPENGTIINMEINGGGALDLTGGDVPGVGDFADADLVFTNRFLPSDVDNQPTYSINFTGPGSITVDSSGIINTHVDEFEIWQNLDPITYEDLWEDGILQANGQSGPDGATFADFFAVEGMLGQDDYKLISNVMPNTGGIAGDYDGSGQVEQADLDLVLLNWGDEIADPESLGWVNNLPDGQIDQGELDGVLLNWGNTAGLAASAAVPEPGTCVLLALAALALPLIRRR